MQTAKGALGNFSLSGNPSYNGNVYKGFGESEKKPMGVDNSEGEEGPSMEIAAGMTKNEVMQSLENYYKVMVEYCIFAEEAANGSKGGVKEYRGHIERAIGGPVWANDQQLIEYAKVQIENLRYEAKSSLKSFERKGNTIYLPRTMQQVESARAGVTVTIPEARKIFNEKVEKHLGVSVFDIDSYDGIYG